MRTQYKNGDDITLTENGCDGCSPSMVSAHGTNGMVICHEYGCPDAWRDRMVECAFCGWDFYPESSGQAFCTSECGIW